jgi:hypothetical protein
MSRQEQHEETTKLRHWIYVLGGSDLRQQASIWQQRKSSGGKWYQVIEAREDERPDKKLVHVGNDDVLYVYSEMSAETLDALGETRKNPGDLARHLAAEGLDNGHRVVKIFASRSGDTRSGAVGSSSYAERLYDEMKDDYPAIAVFGYCGDVSPQGYSSHKTAGLDEGEVLESLTEESWTARNLRAKENRVRFPPESGSA